MHSTLLMAVAWPARVSRVARWGTCAALMLFAAACSSDRLLGNEHLPPDVPDPAETETAAGALAAYRSALVQFRTAFGGTLNGEQDSFVPISGLLTDELQAAEAGLPGVTSSDILVDSRFLPEDPGTSQSTATEGAYVYVYGPLQKVRGQARQARGALQAYAPDSSTALAGHLYAAEGYTEVFLADLFCSGIPLSTLDFGGDYTVKSGSTTEEVYTHAAALFDSALAMSSDSTRVMHLARVGKARALLALGEYAAAAAAVAEVPDAFQYTFAYSTTPSPSSSSGSPGLANRNFAHTVFGGYGSVRLTLVDTAGRNGLAYLSSGDPRTAWVANGSNKYGLALAFPAKYDTTGDGPIVLASGVEARLIEAEAELQAGSTGWLATLNALRTDGTFTTQSNADDPARTDTLWHAGTGGVDGLAPLTDPGTPEARVDLVFRERAFWLYLTGHRQGDLRRLIRQYGRNSETVYPTGRYPGGYGVYGADVTAPIPGSERLYNPRYTGCFSRGA